MQLRGYERVFEMLVASVSVLLVYAVAVAQITTTKPPSTNINPPAPQRQQPAGGQRPQTVNQGIPIAPQPVMQAPANGVIVGYVYWDTQSVTHTPANNCIGLGAAVSAGTPPKGSPTFEQFKILGTYHNFTYLGNVGSLAVCQYSIQQIPTGRDLQIQVGYKQPSFTPVVVPTVPSTANNPNGPIKISGGSCNKVPPAVPSATVLGSGWWTCGNYAYNVNFVLQPATAGNMLSSPTQITVLSATPQGGANGGQNPTNPGLLSGNNQSRGMLAPGATQSASSQANSGALAGNRQLMPGQGGGIQNPGSKVQLNPQPLPPRQLTNADVINMVKAGVPQSAIVTSIQSTPTQFDLSPNGLGALRRAGVNQAILGAMQASGGAASGSGSSNTGVAGAGNAATGKPAAIDPSLLMKLGPPTTSAQVKNPRAGQINGAIIVVLKKQRSVADIEASQMKLSLRPVVQAGPAGGSQLMSATGGAGSSLPGTTGSSAATGVSAVGTGKGASGNIPASISHLSHFNSTALTCANDPTFRIITVSGSAGPATFTPIDQYNLYTITGCSFGNPGSNDKVYIYGAGSFQGNFAIKFWSDNSIAVTLDESISGYPDLSNINLVVQRNDGQQTQKPGFNFYAFRQAVPLSTMPSSWAKLVTLTSGFKTMSPQYSSPPSSSPGPGPTAGTSYVSRLYDGAKFDPTGKSDYYDFSQLAAGWTTDSFQVTTYLQTCVWVVTYKQNFGSWHWDWDRNNLNNIRVWFSDTTCSGFNAVVPLGLQNYQNLTRSDYALKVWVIGPRGIDPLTGQRAP
jgi:hypothetical protein